MIRAELNVDYNSVIRTRAPTFDQSIRSSEPIRFRGVSPRMARRQFWTARPADVPPGCADQRLNRQRSEFATPEQQYGHAVGLLKQRLFTEALPVLESMLRSEDSARVRYALTLPGGDSATPWPPPGISNGPAIRILRCASGPATTPISSLRRSSPSCARRW